MHNNDMIKEGEVDTYGSNVDFNVMPVPKVEIIVYNRTI